MTHYTRKLFLMLLFCIPTLRPQSARADGMLEGMADGMNDIFVNASDSASNLGEQIEKTVKPAANQFAQNMRKITGNLLTEISMAASKAKQNLNLDTPDK